MGHGAERDRCLQRTCTDECILWFGGLRGRPGYRKPLVIAAYFCGIWWVSWRSGGCHWAPLGTALHCWNVAMTQNALVSSYRWGWGILIRQHSDDSLRTDTGVSVGQMVCCPAIMPGVSADEYGPSLTFFRSTSADSGTALASRGTCTG